MAVTIADVAKKAGVGIGTVSRVVNGGVHVREDTRTRVMQAMSDLGYHPNAHAQNLKRATATAIGFLFMSDQRQMSDPFFSTLMAGMADAAGELNHDLHVVSCRQPSKELVTLERLIHSNRVSGLILTDTRLDDMRVDVLLKAQFPFVAFGRTQMQSKYTAAPYVDVDGRMGMRQTMAHLIGMGHRRIGFITLPAHLMCAQDRLNGYHDGLDVAGIAINPAYTVAGGLSEADGQRAATELLLLSEPPTALVCCSDVMAFGAARAIVKRGLRVGYDMALVGFDDIPLAAHASPPLTTVHQPIYDIGCEVVQILVQHIQGQATQSRLIEPRLIIRESTSGAVPKHEKEVRIAH